jgi:hypothetical protein
MIGANLRAPNAITKNALSRLTSYGAITAALAELRNSLGFDSWNGLIALRYGPQTEKHSERSAVGTVITDRCAYYKSSPSILVMQTTQDRTAQNAPRCLGGT